MTGKIAGFVLAGGESRRMGRDKALMELNGEPLVVHALRILEGAGAMAKIAGARPDLKNFAEIVPDTEAGRGPLSGICSALAGSDEQNALFIPVDMPLLPSSLLIYMVHRAEVTKSLVTVVSVCGFPQSFPVLVNRATLPILQDVLKGNRGGCYAAFQAAAAESGRPIDVVPLEYLVQAGSVSHPAGLPAACWFLNVNSPEALRRVQAQRSRVLA